jgi:uncharacterized membrane protein YfcA
VSLFDQSAAFVAVAILAAFTVGLSKGGLPAVGSLAVPLMALVISPVVAAGLLLPIYIASDGVGLWLYRREFSARNLQILVPAGLLGVGIGWMAAEAVSEEIVLLFVGFVGLFYCLSSWLRRQPTHPRPADWPRGLAWGTLSGFSSFVAHSGAAPFQVYVLPQRLEKMVFAGTSTILFAIINFAKIPPYWALGQMNLGTIESAAILMPVAMVGAVSGMYATRLLPERVFFESVKIALFLISLKLVWDGLAAIL